jgi:Holliday junction resolvase RusA-like endonuclease
MITLTLPLPPSVNASTRNVAKVGRVKTAAYRNWIAEADASYMEQKRGVKPLTGPYTFHMWVPQNMRGDVDGRLKAAIDYLVRVELTPDDRHCQKVTVERWHMVEEGKCLVVARTHETPEAFVKPTYVDSGQTVNTVISGDS